MLIKIPPTSEVVPGTDYKGFELIASFDPRAYTPCEIESADLGLSWPNSLILNTDRHVLCQQGLMLGIGVAFALKANPQAIPAAFRQLKDDEPIKIISSTRMLSSYDGRNYLAYFYIDRGQLITSYIAEKPWASACPSPILIAR